MFFINYAYFDEARAFGNGSVHTFAVRIEDAGRAAQIAADIDRLFANSPDETLTQSERDWISAQINRVGNISFIVNSIVGAVLFALLFVTGNTMMQAIRERTPELAVLKTYGYSNGTLTLSCCRGGVSLRDCRRWPWHRGRWYSPTMFDAMGVAALPLETSGRQRPRVRTRARVGQCALRRPGARSGSRSSTP